MGGTEGWKSCDRVTLVMQLAYPHPHPPTPSSSPTRLIHPKTLNPSPSPPGEDGDVLRHAFQEEEFSQIVLADSGKMVFGATESGIVKALKLPLTGEVVAPPIKAHAIVAGSQNYW